VIAAGTRVVGGVLIAVAAVADTAWAPGTIPGYTITSKKRAATLPNVPTSAEAGVPKFDVTTRYGLYAPRNTPKPIVDTLVAALQKAPKDPALVNRCAELSMTPVEEDRPPAALERVLKAEIEKCDRIIKAAGTTPQ
jgi:tripartite-type tricarboxylate transporter receptor subunit TctC